MPFSIREYAISFTFGTKVYFGLGNSSYIDKSDVKSDLWSYDVISGNWEEKAPFPGGGRSDAFVFVVGNKAYIGCGYYGNSNYYNDFWEYDIDNNSWNQKSSYPGGGRRSLFAFSINGKGYVGTGFSFGQTYWNDFYEYNPSNDLWMQKNDFPISSGEVIGFVVNNNVFAGGKYLGYINSENKYDKRVFKYSVSNDSWIEKTEFPTNEGFNGISFSMGNKGYVGNGEIFWAYNENTNTWEEFDADYYLLGRIFSTGAVVNNSLYFGTGYQGNSTLLNDFWIFKHN